MAEYHAYPVWCSDEYTTAAVNLPERLERELDLWGQEYTQKNLQGLWAPGERTEWVTRGKQLAEEVRRSVGSPAIRVLYLEDREAEDEESDWVEIRLAD